MPPMMPTTSAKKVSSGSAITRPSTRGRTSSFGDVETDRLHRVDFLVDPHGADLGGEGRARAARDDDGGDEAAELAQEADAQEIDGVDLRAEALQLVGALIGEHDAEQEGQQPDDGQRGDAGFLDLMDQRRKRQFAPRRMIASEVSTVTRPRKPDQVVGLP